MFKRLFLIWGAVCVAVVVGISAAYLIAMPQVSAVHPVRFSYRDTVQAQGIYLGDRAVVYIPLDRLEMISEGQEVSVHCNEKEYTGTVSLVTQVFSAAYVIGSPTNCVEASIDVDGLDAPVYSQLECFIFCSQQRELMGVSKQSVLQDELGEYIYLVSNSHAVKRYIITDDSVISNYIAVDSGITFSDTIVADAAEFERVGISGARVKAG